MAREGKLQFVAVVGFIIGSFFISSLLESGYEPPVKKEVKQRLIVVKAKEVEASKHAITFGVSGVIEAKNTIDIVPQVSGKVVKIDERFFSGGSFQKGEVLFEIEPDDFQLQVSQKEAELSAAHTLYEMELAQRKAAMMEWQQESDNEKAADLVSRSLQLKEAQANLKAAQAQLDNAKLNLKRTKFTLPFDGRVVESTVGVGQHIVAGQAYGKVFDAAVLEVKSSLSDHQLQWLFSVEEPKVTLTTRYLGKQVAHVGTFKRGAAALDNNTRFAAVYFGFETGVEALIPGIFVDVQVQGPEMEDVMIMPLSALQNNNVVWMVDNEALVRWKPEIIYIDEHHVIVKSDGKSTANIVVSRLLGGVEGMKVKISEASDAVVNTMKE